jgi:hypothetical protein
MTAPPPAVNITDGAVSMPTPRVINRTSAWLQATPDST